MAESKHRKIVIALGGNAIASGDHTGDIDQQFAASRETAKHIVDLVSAGHHVLLTHGNGPQVGATLRRVELARPEVYPIPLALCVANTQAGMGFMISQCVRNELRARDERVRAVPVCTVITTVRVDTDDEAFAHPRKPIGQDYDEATALDRVQSEGWDIVEASPGRWRRVVASPMPQIIEEIELIGQLFDEGRLVICCGGGGIPVVEIEGGGMHTADAVIDKDQTARLLAVGTKANTLLILTDVAHVLLDRGTENERAADQLTIAEAKLHLEEGQFGEGSMAPKVRACIGFLEQTTEADAMAVIAKTDQCMEALAGEAGTRVVR